MGQKVNPVGMRVGINRDWNSKWFAIKGEYAAFLDEDIQIRRYLDKELKNAMLSHVEIGRVKTDKGHNVDVKVYVARPGEVIGQDGANIVKIRKNLTALVKSGPVHIDVLEVRNPDLDATLVAKWIASELENRAAFRSTMKKALQRMRKAGAKGCKTNCAGRLGGAEIAREEGYKEGVVPLHTVRADIDFAHIDASTPYGRIGVKVWICRSLNKGDEPEQPVREQREPRRDGRRQGGKENVAA